MIISHNGYGEIPLFESRISPNACYATSRLPLWQSGRHNHGRCGESKLCDRPRHCRGTLRSVLSSATLARGCGARNVRYAVTLGCTSLHPNAACGGTSRILSLCEMALRKKPHRITADMRLRGRWAVFFGWNLGGFFRLTLPPNASYTLIHNFFFNLCNGKT